LTSYNDHPEVVTCLYVKLGFLDIALELNAVEAVDYFLDLVKVSLVAILVSIVQDIVSINASIQV
jgi:hypothetical protein